MPPLLLLLRVLVPLLELLERVLVPLLLLPERVLELRVVEPLLLERLLERVLSVRVVVLVRVLRPVVVPLPVWVRAVLGVVGRVLLFGRVVVELPPLRCVRAGAVVSGLRLWFGL